MSQNGITLDNDNRAQRAEWLDQDALVVACLCAAWCDTCCSYRPGFEQLAARHPDKRFIWIDIEDQADFIGDIDVENFPTLLIQRGDNVAFFGTTLPELKLAERLIASLADKSPEELRAEAASSPERAEWQRVGNLRAKLRETAA